MALENFQTTENQFDLLAQVFILLMPAFIGLLTAWLAWLAKTYSQQSSTATNTILVELQELLLWKRSYDNSPWRTGYGVEVWIEEHKAEHDALREIIHEELVSLDKCLYRQQLNNKQANKDQDGKSNKSTKAK